MTRTDFLNKLQEGLSGEVSQQVVRETVEYYNRYINEAMAEGRTEEQIMEELGPVQLIIKSIRDANAGSNQKEQSYRQYQELEPERGRTSGTTVIPKAVLILVAIIIAVLILAIIVIIVMAAWYLLPVLAVIALVVLLLRIFLGRKK